MERSVHPHVRGEYAALAAAQGEFTGSSPRAWGILQGNSTKTVSDRFIPTCVGNTPAPSACPLRSSVHPHVRGEYTFAGDDEFLSGGSSPRAWGIRGAGGAGMPMSRFIPTCVGNTCRQPWRPSCSAVHPHVRGEYGISRNWHSPISGSSPRAWGIPDIEEILGLVFRFIPTCVGNTSPDWNRTHNVPVHPHVRGEYLLFFFHTLLEIRFIPTCVGNTCPRLCGAALLSVHPHVRGEYWVSRLSRSGRFGSSPRAWGIRISRQSTFWHHRFIPTCVGNTC